jgi:hypothetical protein
MDGGNGQRQGQRSQDAVYKKAAAHRHPGQGEEWNVEQRINEPHIRKRELIVDEQGKSGDSSGYKLSWNQNGIDGNGAENAAGSDKEEVSAELAE